MKNIVGGKMKAQKGGRCGNEMWSAHRLESDVKKFGTKNVKKKKVVIEKEKNPLDRKIEHML